MPFSFYDLVEQSGVGGKVLEGLLVDLPLGSGRLYSRRKHRKRYGGVREIFEPRPPFDAVSKNLHRSFSDQLLYETPDHVHGFVKGRSAISNARQHLAKECVLRIDLEDFFPSIDAAMVKALFDAQGFEDKAAEAAVRLVTIDDKLPIGLSTSPLLSNLIFEETDRELVDYVRAENLTFTRYVDDLTFSGEVTDRHAADISRILDDAGWSVNARKTAFMRRGGPQYVTGLYVGDAQRPRVPRALKRRMRWVVHIISKFGYDTYMAEFGGEDEEMHRDRLLGWASHIAAVEPDFGRPLLKDFRNLVPDN